MVQNEVDYVYAKLMIWRDKKISDGHSVNKVQAWGPEQWESVHF